MAHFSNSNRSVPDVGIQIYKMGLLFPSFKYYRKSGQMFWIGTLQPTTSSPTYSLRIIYRMKKSPKVFVISPQILHNPHQYPDKSLCLHFPPDRSWFFNSMIAETVIPWSAEWLLCYEYWIETGIWPGEEAPHKGVKTDD